MIDQILARDNSTSLISGEADDLILGKVSQVKHIDAFQDIYFTNASITDAGSSYKLDTTNSELRKGDGTLLFDTDFFGVKAASGLNASLVTSGGVTLQSTGPVATTLVGSAQADTITGGSGNDVIEGGKGPDVLNGGIQTESYTYTLVGNLDPAAGGTYSITINGAVLPVQVEGGPLFPVNASAGVVGNALAAFINTNLALINAGPNDIVGATYTGNNIGGDLVITYATPGVNVPNGDTSIVLGVDLSGQLGAPINVNGSDGGSDQFVFHHGDSTKVQATADVINGFVGAGADTIRLFFADNVAIFTGDNLAGVGNYVEAGAAVANFAAALTAANAALLALSGTTAYDSIVSFQFDANNGYLFQDVDANGVADQVVILTGIDNTEIAHTDLV